MPINKVIYGNSTLIDLTQDTTVESNVASGKTFHKKDGSLATGTAEMAQASYSNQTITLTNGFPVSVGGGVDVTPLSVTENGTYTAPSGTAYSPVTVNVSGSTPTGKILITTTNEVNVANYATAQVSDSNLTSANIISGKSILGVNGSAVVPSGSQTINANGTYDITSKAQVVVNVSGGGGKVIQYNANVGQVKNKTSMTTTNVSLVVEETGNYKVSWVAWAYAKGTSSQNYSTQIYADGSAKGSSHYASVYSGTGTFAFTENSIALTAGQTVEIRARTRSGSSYYTTAGMLVIEKI